MSEIKKRLSTIIQSPTFGKEEKLQKIVEKILSEALDGKVSVSNFNYNFNEIKNK